MQVLRSVIVMMFFCVTALAEGSFSGTTVVPAAGAGNTMTLSQPTNGNGGSTTAITLDISDETKTYKRNIDYTVSGLPGSSPVIEWLPGKRPAKDTKLTIAGDTAAQGSYATSVTWS